MNTINFLKVSGAAIFVMETGLAQEIAPTPSSEVFVHAEDKVQLWAS